MRQLVEQATSEMLEDFLENPVIDGFYSKDQLETLYICLFALPERTLLNFKDIVF